MGSQEMLLQRYRRDRRELLSFILSASIFRKVVMPPGAVTLDDIDLEQVSIDYILECAKKGGILELSEAIKKFHDDAHIPAVANSLKGDIYYLVTDPQVSGPPPMRSVPAPAALSPPVAKSSLSKSISIQSTPSQQISVDDEIDDFEDDNEVTGELSRRKLNDASDLVLKLPPFATGLSEDDLRETAYEVLLASVGATAGLVAPPKEKKEEKKMKLVRKFTRSKSEKHKPEPTKAQGLAGLLELMRTQLEISEASDKRTREALLHSSAGRVGKRMDTLLIPLELLCGISRADFTEKKVHLRWQRRQLNLLEEGLVNFPAVSLEHNDRQAGELRTLIAKIEEAETLPSPAGPAQHAEALKALRGVSLALAERASRGDQIGEVCHWADGYHLNVRIYERLLSSTFDILDEGQLIEEADEILELLKSTWKILGITQTVHNTCYTWVLFRQFVITDEVSLLQHAAQQMKRIASDSQRSAQERAYMKSLRSTIVLNGTSQDLSFVQSIVEPIKTWVEKRLNDYHLHFSEDAAKMEQFITLVMIAGRLIAEEDEKTEITRMTSAANQAAIAKQAEEYIWSSVKLAYERALEGVDAKSEAEHDHPLALLAEDVEALARKDASTFAPILSRWQPQAKAITGSLLHTLYYKELKPFLDGVSHLTDDVASVLPAADSLDRYLTELVGAVDDGNNVYRQQMTFYEVENLSATLIMRWVNAQLSRLSDWVDRTVRQEKWEPLSMQKRQGESVVEVFRIIDETVEQFFGLKLPMKISLLKGLTNGLDNALQLYCNKIVGQLGTKADLIPPPPSLTRYGKDTSLKMFSKKRFVDPGLPDDRRGDDIRLLTTSRLCVRLNSIYYILNQVDVLEDNIRDRWRSGKSTIKPKTEANGRNGDVRVRPLDEISSSFDGSRKAANAAIDKICEFTGTKLIFWDMRDPFIDGLYKGGVTEARMEQVVNNLDPILGQIVEMVVEALRDRLVLGLLQAAIEGLIRVLLDGGPSRAFSHNDVDMLEHDLRVLKNFFIAEGEGLQRGVVENAAAPAQQIIELYRLETYVLIENFRKASDRMASGTSVQRTGIRAASDADTLLRILCHRMDDDASQFLKRQYKLPKSTA
ncbi:uncharacterized protein LOC9647607 [Selaginella moellendorffii]|uniref:uncharacterized protein LOC9647607 n=1 Tax=Selaginella moellendorffii TaxID=88036 RepID=UPI000D1C5C7A|nr:uncharacterized protein LOC9647607 [Selaginella moellendorffii]XP_024542201.1 uncharacterized protein LOC9647607 [Selaginella moellendorffii]|eukprot:XP_024542200.1 uncharacterized protein LOC9647607 [Selaginella moellendorffii]